MKAFEFISPLEAGIPTKLALFSDIHFDSPNCARDILKAHFTYCQQDGRWILIGGDFFDAILLKDMKRSANHLMEATDNQLNVKLEEAAHFLDPYKDRILFMGRGNHEESILKYSGFDLLQMLTVLLNAGQKHQIQYGNYANFLRFGWAKPSSPNAIHAHYDIYQHHGAGANAPVSKGMIDFNRIMHGVNADLVWIGHKHNSIVLGSDPIMSIGKNGEINMKNRQAIMTPSYQKAATMDYNINFSERFYTPQSLPGFGEVTLTPKYEDDKVVIQKDVRLNVNPQAIIGNIISQKVKQRKR